MLKIVFIPTKRAPSSIKPVDYIVDQFNNVIAVSLAKIAFIDDGHKPQYYDNVLITNARVL